MKLNKQRQPTLSRKAHLSGGEAALSPAGHLSAAQRPLSRRSRFIGRLRPFIARSAFILGGLLPAVGIAQAPNLTVCAGKNFQLTSNVDATGTSEVTYTWYENGVPIPGSNTASITITAGEAAAGNTYHYARKAANAECPAGVFSNTYTVAVLAAPAAPTGANSYTGCVAGPTAFYVDEPEGGITIDWYADATGGTPITSETATMIRNLDVGAHTFYAEARNKTTGCVSTVRVAAAATINPEPAAPTDASANARCGSGTVTFSASVPDGITIDWYTEATGGSIVSGGSSIASFSPELTGSTTYYAEARNTSGCVSPLRLPVGSTVMSYPDTPALTRTTGTVCNGSYIYFYASGGSGTYVWSGDVTGSGATVTSNSTAAGNYTATVYSTTTTSGVTCQSSPISTTGPITAGAGDRSAPNGCGCASGSVCATTSLCGRCPIPACTTYDQAQCLITSASIPDAQSCSYHWTYPPNGVTYRCYVFWAHIPRCQGCK